MNEFIELHDSISNDEILINVNHIEGVSRELIGQDIIVTHIDMADGEYYNVSESYDEVKYMLMGEYTEIKGDGDLHYCGYCKADLSNAWIENYNHCPECHRIFKENKYYAPYSKVWKKFLSSPKLSAKLIPRASILTSVAVTKLFSPLIPAQYFSPLNCSINSKAF